jgi:hypothetical protein
MAGAWRCWSLENPDSEDVWDRVGRVSERKLGNRLLRDDHCCHCTLASAPFRAKFRFYLIFLNDKFFL